MSIYSSNITPLGKQIVDAIVKLQKNQLVLDLIAENTLYAGGIERFIQRLFLWAFQTVPDAKYILEMESTFPPLTGNSAIDLVAFENSADFRKSYTEQNLTPTQIQKFASGVIEMKDNWNRASIVNDLNKMHKICTHARSVNPTNYEFYEILIISNSTYDNEFDLIESIDDHCKQTLKIICSSDKVASIDRVAKIGLLQKSKNPSFWQAWVSMELHVIRIEFN